MPPFGQLASILVSSRNIQKLRAYLQELQYLKPQTKTVQVFGPVRAPLSYLKNHYRYRFLVHTTHSGMHLQHFIAAWFLPIKCPSSIKQIVDINPQSFI
jgi:primosomal protein N' (replication factor Y)